MPIDNRLYEAKDLKKILGLTPETIYLWLGTYHIFEPAQRAPSVRGKNKYSFIDIIKLALIAILQTLGIHLSHIRGIITELDNDENGVSLWKLIMEERDRFDREGATVIVRRDSGYRVEFGAHGPNESRLHFREPRYLVRILSYDKAAKELSFNVKAPIPRIIIPINLIVTSVEMRIHKKLNQQNSKKANGP